MSQLLSKEEEREFGAILKDLRQGIRYSPVEVRGPYTVLSENRYCFTFMIALPLHRYKYLRGNIAFYPHELLDMRSLIQFRWIVQERTLLLVKKVNTRFHEDHPELLDPKFLLPKGEKNV